MESSRPVLGRLDELRRDLPPKIAANRGEPYEPPSWEPALATIDEIVAVLHEAHVVPLTDQVRVEMGDLTDRVVTLSGRVAENRRAAALA